MQTAWSRARITAVLYPLGAGATALNVFFASLLGAAIGFRVLTPLASLMIGAILGLPLTWIFAGHILRLMAQATPDPASDPQHPTCPPPEPAARCDRSLDTQG